MVDMEDFKRVALDAIGVGAGYIVSDIAGEVTAKATKQTGWGKVGVKVLMRIIVSVLGLFLGGATTGLISTVLFMFAVGSFAGIFVDILGGIFPGGIATLTTAMVVKMNRAEGVITVRAEKPEEIKELVRW